MTTDNNNTQNPSVDIDVKPKKGRPPIPLDQKRRSFVMLRLNSPEIERFYTLKKDRQWTGDDASFARDLILSKRKGQGSSVDLLKLEEVLSALYQGIPDVMSESYTQEQRKYVVETVQALLKDALRIIYRSKKQ
ncbi:hypothetical protein MSNKSG1_00758 [Marinobacter santoriniensis NKSG1]|uniref:Uncharacterized protein n=1 Tax=Marinobacter santoriniensis NKSG1 TaxID=1288826 RepID=M7D8Q5_9GAMM|nr:hypothetical protein [Marinobacter santoriniensis]EMP57108.1 hypothetical protein MSNKSG1_00758 [Marinobacter santoriniensis NKSG1]